MTPMHRELLLGLPQKIAHMARCAATRAGKEGRYEKETSDHYDS